ncbi:MAG: ATP-binding protein [Actinomycetota bacterium]|nr:ATP-binding protein [Actinomycetota bacterium]
MLPWLGVGHAWSGRELELERLDAALDAAPSGTRAEVVEGEGGAGKTTLWREALLHAADRCYTVLSCHPAESEAKLSFQGLADLLGPVLDATIGELPVPQRHALEVALLGSEEAGGPVDLRTVCMGALEILRVVCLRTIDRARSSSVCPMKRWPPGEPPCWT